MMMMGGTWITLPQQPNDDQPMRIQMNSYTIVHNRTQIVHIDNDKSYTKIVHKSYTIVRQIVHKDRTRIVHESYTTIHESYKFVHSRTRIVRKAVKVVVESAQPSQKIVELTQFSPKSKLGHHPVFRSLQES